MTRPFWVAGRPVTAAQTATVRHSFDGSVAGTHCVPTDADVEAAVSAAQDVLQTSAHVRAAALDHVSRSLTARTEEFAQLITSESAKPIKWARAEVGRAAST